MAHLLWRTYYGAPIRAGGRAGGQAGVVVSGEGHAWRWPFRLRSEGWRLWRTYYGTPTMAHLLWCTYTGGWAGWWSGAGGGVRGGACLEVALPTEVEIDHVLIRACAVSPPRQERVGQAHWGRERILRINLCGHGRGAGLSAGRGAGWWLEGEGEGEGEGGRVCVGMRV